jgi:hypothetical protein
MHGTVGEQGIRSAARSSAGVTLEDSRGLGLWIDFPVVRFGLDDCVVVACVDHHDRGRGAVGDLADLDGLGASQDRPGAARGQVARFSF